MQDAVYGTGYATATTTTTTAAAAAAATTTTIPSTPLPCIVGTVHGTMVTNQGKGNNARHHKGRQLQPQQTTT